MATKENELEIPKLYAPNLIYVCVDSTNTRDHTGEFWHPYSEGSIPFNGLWDLVKKMDELFDVWDFPQKSNEYREFGKNPKETRTNKKQDTVQLKNTDIQDGKRKGEIASFLVHILYRQNATWQGYVIWHEGRKRLYFRSAFELMRMVDLAILQGD